MNDTVETITFLCPGGAPFTMTKHQDGDISFLGFNGVRQGSASETMLKLFATIKANGSGTPPTIGRVDS
jgi:hypothetical protein